MFLLENLFFLVCIWLRQEKDEACSLARALPSYLVVGIVRKNFFSFFRGGDPTRFSPSLFARAGHAPPPAARLDRYFSISQRSVVEDDLDHMPVVC
jgi:hypothetical protein